MKIDQPSEKPKPIKRTPFPGGGYVLCEHDDPGKTHFWCPNEQWWCSLEHSVNSPGWCGDKHGRKCATHWRKPERVINEGWISVKERLPQGSPDSKWLCFFDYGDSSAVTSQTLKQIMAAGTDSCLTHWMPFPNPPEPAKMENGVEKAWRVFEKQWPESFNPKQVFLAGYEAGRKG